MHNVNLCTHRKIIQTYHIRNHHRILQCKISQSLKMGYINCWKTLNLTGPDNIQARYLKELALELTPAITFIFQTSLEQGKLPNDWLQSHIVPVFKKKWQNHCIQLSNGVINIYTMQNTPAYSKCKYHETYRCP